MERNIEDRGLFGADEGRRRMGWWMSCRGLGAAAGVALSALLELSPAMAADQSLIDAAKKEGHVTWYTTQIVDQFARPAAEAFEKKYGIHVDYVRADPIDIVLRISNEGKAGHVQADVFDGTSTDAEPQEGGAGAQMAARFRRASAGTICRPRAAIGSRPTFTC